MARVLGLLLLSLGSAHASNSRTAAIQEAFNFAWKGYSDHAFGHDTLHPVDNTYDNDRNGWGATIFDALDTAVIMQNKAIVTQILDYIPTVNWAATYQDSDVSLFETTIRYLGGMLSAHDLMVGPFASLVAGQEHKVRLLIDQAVNLANNISFAFDTPTGIPYNGLKMSSRSHQGDPNNGLAGIGTLVLEWTRLADIVHNDEYARYVQKAESYLLQPQPSQDEAWPGLVGLDVDINSGMFNTDAGTWDGGGDSFYEYLIKMYVYDSKAFGQYKDRWIAAADSTIAHIGSHPQTQKNLTYLANWKGQQLTKRTGNLACFSGGNFILGGLALKQQKYIDFGVNLAESCYHTFQVTASGIGFGSWTWDENSVPADQQDFWKRNGFVPDNTGYPLRPEVVESLYYAWRATGNTKYRDWSWDAFRAINATCRTGSGFSGINDVRQKNGGGFDNIQQTWFLAETLKYLYLTQSDDAVFQVNTKGVNNWVFNTESHPMQVRGTPI